MSSEQSLSPEAQKLIELTVNKHGCVNPDIDLGEIISEHPDLIKGLREYTSWRDKEMMAVAEVKKTIPINHELRGVTAKIGKMPRK